LRLVGSDHLPHRLRLPRRRRGADPQGRCRPGPHRAGPCVPTLTGSACKRRCAAKPRIESGWSRHAAAPPARLHRTSGRRATLPGGSRQGPRRRGATAPRTWWFRRWSLCSRWRRWCRGRDCAMRWLLLIEQSRESDFRLGSRRWAHDREDRAFDPRQIEWPLSGL